LPYEPQLHQKLDISGNYDDTDKCQYCLLNP